MPNKKKLMLIIHYNKSVDADGRPVFDALNGTMLVLGREREGWQLPPKEVKLAELAEPWRGVYLALASGLASAGEAWVASRVTATLGEFVTGEGEGECEGLVLVPCVELVVNAVQDGTGATRMFTSRDNEGLRVVDEEVINLYNELHA